MGRIILIFVLVYMMITFIDYGRSNATSNSRYDKVNKNLCTTRNGIQGKCMKRSLCADKDIETLVDVRSYKQFPKDCENEWEVCCKVPRLSSKYGSEPNSKCGRRKLFVNQRILSSTKTEFAEIPWMAAILTVELEISDVPLITSYLCGGSLIHPKVVLTAAHCIMSIEASGKDHLAVRAGEWNSMSDSEMLPHQERMVDKIISHENYYAGGLHNDIALLILRTEFEVADNVGFVCLPSGDSGSRDDCVASGWGKDDTGDEGKFSYILKKVVMSMIDAETCQSMLRKTRLGVYFRLHESFVCAGGEEGKDTCKGDGGSPLVCPVSENSNQFVQTGIVSWGIDCGKAGVPGVYTSVRLFRTWIADRLTENKIDISQYIY